MAISAKSGLNCKTYTFNCTPFKIQKKEDQQLTILNPANCQSRDYRYDSFHRRLSKTVENITTDYIYLKDNEIGTIVGQATKELRILGLGKGAEVGAAVAIELEGTPYVPIHDPYGNVATLLNLNGEVTTSYRYTAFGEEEIKGESQNAWRYSSKRVDPETGYIYFGRRYYMPSIGRWLTPDPLWFADGPNLYAYVHNRPMISIDPDGQFAFLIPIALSLALDYCMPTIVAGLTECALGGGLLASALSGFVSGYNDPFSSAFDPDTYSIGDADWTNFACNRACMLLGAAVACKPTNAAKNGVKSVVNVASREIAGTVIAKTEVALTKAITNGVKQGGRTAAQKTASVAERNFAKGGVDLTKKSCNLTPQKFFGSKTHIEMETLLTNKFGPPKGSGAYNKSFYNQKTGRTFNLHWDPLHRGGRPHIDIRKRGLDNNYYKDRPFFLLEE